MFLLSALLVVQSHCFVEVLSTWIHTETNAIFIETYVTIICIVTSPLMLQDYTLTCNYKLMCRWKGNLRQNDYWPVNRNKRALMSRFILCSYTIQFIREVKLYHPEIKKLITMRVEDTTALIWQNYQMSFTNFTMQDPTLDISSLDFLHTAVFFL